MFLATPRFGVVDHEQAQARQCWRTMQHFQLGVQRLGASRHYVLMSGEARFRELFGEHYPAVARYVLARGFQAADADDLIAATFEVAWRRLDAVPAGEEALPWLLSTARNFARNADRKAHRERTLVNGLAHATPPWREADLDQRAEWDGVRLALAELRPVDRDLILLVAWDGLSADRVPAASSGCCP